MCVISSSELHVLSVAKAAIFLLTVPSMSHYISSNPLTKFKKEIVGFSVCGHHYLWCIMFWYLSLLMFINMGLSIDDVL